VPKLTNEVVASIVAAGVERTVFDSATPGFGLRLKRGTGSGGRNQASSVPGESNKRSSRARASLN